MEKPNKYILPLVVVLGLIASIISCTTSKWYSEGIDGTMKNEYVKVLTQEQIDSICIADTLPININDWVQFLSRDFESGDKIEQYIFVKRNGKDNETVYIISRFNDNKNYRMQKRNVK